ncbi:hypothetical protein LOK49_LG03G03027 [Camellia lanceoleosa]|uniref:Uncharacterized protein n=1 Tax=Camellia lanceoleosa TaxID=1840588 RepID=A0ACC0IB54_9ERIC|nr:hypothetical protein LOK49_LG03G03027 [Camellia lanceoleosa]
MYSCGSGLCGVLGHGLKQHKGVAFTRSIFHLVACDPALGLPQLCAFVMESGEVVEITKGSKVKYELDKKTGMIKASFGSSPDPKFWLGICILPIWPFGDSLELLRRGHAKSSGGVNLRYCACWLDWHSDGVFYEEIMIDPSFISHFVIIMSHHKPQK